jgi:hypothetical protein
MWGSRGSAPLYINTGGKYLTNAYYLLIYTIKYIKIWKHCSGRVYLPLQCSCEGRLCVVWRSLEGVTCTHCYVTNSLVNINILQMIPFHFIDSKISEWKLCFVLMIVSVRTYVTLRCPFFWETTPHYGWLLLDVSRLRDSPIVKGCMSDEWTATKPWRWDQFAVLKDQPPISHWDGALSQENWGAHTRLSLRQSNLVALKTPYILFA